MGFRTNLVHWFPLKVDGADSIGTASPTVSSVTFTGTHADFTASTSSYIHWGNIFNVGTADFTMAGWVYVNSYAGSGHQGAVFSKAPSSLNSQTGAALQFYNSNSIGEVGSGGVKTTASTSLPSTGSWHHVALTRSGTTIKLYQDGVLVDTQTSASTYNITSAASNNFLTVGAVRIPGAAFWYGGLNGSANDLLAYDGRALTASEIAQIHAAGQGNFQSLLGLEDGLRSYYEAASVYDSWNVIDLTKGSEISVQSSGDHFVEYYDKWYFGFGTNNANSYLRKVGGIPVAAANNMTFACWAKDIQSTGDKNLVTFVNGEVLIYVDNASNELGVYDGAFYSSGVSFPYGSGWKHIAATYDDASGVTTFFIDGAQVGTVTRTLSFVALEYIGGLQGSARQFAAGLDDIVVWERKLTADEISTVYDASESGFSPFYKLIPGRQINDNNDEIGWLSTPLTNTFNKLNYHMNTVISSSASSSYSEDFESTAIGSLPAGWSTFGDQNWEVTGSDAHAGTKSAGSNPALLDNQSTSLVYTASLGSAQTLTFWWKVSSENNFDWLTFYIDGVQQDRISGSPAWAEKSFSLPSGSSVLKWTYAKDSSATSGQDAAWIDDINIGTAGGYSTPDGSGNDHDGTLYNITAEDTGSYITLYSGSLVGGAATEFTASLNFNGSTSKLDTGVTPNDVGIVSSNEKSIMFWASSSAWVDYKPFFSMGTNSTRQDFTLIQKTDGNIQLNTWGDDLTFTPPSTSGWHHYACTYDNGSNVISVYIDGQLAGSKTLGGALNTSNANNILIGAGAHYWASHFFSGSIQEFSLFSSELSAQNVLDVYNHQYPKIVSGGDQKAINLYGSILHDAPPHNAAALNMWGSLFHDAPPNNAAALNMWGTALHGGPPIQNVSAVNLYGSVLHDGPENAAALNMWGSLLHDAPPPNAAALNMWGTALHGGPPPENVSAINLYGSILHDAPENASALNMWGSLLHDAPPTNVAAINMFASLVHSSSASPGPSPLPVISASVPTLKLVEQTSLNKSGYVFNTYRVGLLSVQRARTVMEIPFKLGTKGKQSLRLRTNEEFTGSA